MDLLVTGPGSGPVLLLAHGAGATMDSPFMEAFAALMGERDIGVARFEFAYMAARRGGGKRRPPPRAETLQGEYRDAVAAVHARMAGRAVVIGGKSMGGRVASLVADSIFAERRSSGLVCLGYPFHPPNKPENLRTAHLEGIVCPTLIVQGERDPFGGKSEVQALNLPPAITFHWASDGDHDLGPRGNSGFTRKGNLASAADAVAAFVVSVTAKS